VIELADFSLRGGNDAPSAAARAARVTERYLPAQASRDLSAVVSELVDTLAHGSPAPRTLRLELAVTASIVRVAVTAQLVNPGELTSTESLRESLPVTSSLASRYGVEAGHRMRLWAEFDRERRFQR
jgi:hypothetical protein